MYVVLDIATKEEYITPDLINVNVRGVFTSRKDANDTLAYWQERRHIMELHKVDEIDEEQGEY